MLLSSIGEKQSMKATRYDSFCLGLFLVLTLILSAGSVPVAAAATAGTAPDDDAVQAFAQAIEERFLRYVQVDAKNDDTSTMVPIRRDGLTCWICWRKNCAPWVCRRDADRQRLFIRHASRHYQNRCP